MYKNLKVLLLILFLISHSSTSFAKQPILFIEELVSEATAILSSDESKFSKVEKLKNIAINAVDIEGIGLYTLGKYRKTITEEEKTKYNILFKDYFLKSFSNRLVEYEDAKISVISENVKSEKYTIVSSKLMATKERPEVKIDWRVYTKNPDKPLIRDLIIEDLSLARSQQEEFRSVIENNDGNLEALFESLSKYINK